MSNVAIKQTTFEVPLAPDHQQEMSRLTKLVEYDIAEKKRKAEVEKLKKKK
jgi:hypothetical protein